MQLLYDLNDYYDHLFGLVSKKPISVSIATYGIWAGLRADGSDMCEKGSQYRSKTRDLLDALQQTRDVRLLVSTSSYSSCRGYHVCYDCERRFVAQLFRLLSHVDKFSNYQWRMLHGCHLKCSLFTYVDDACGIAGGRNFTDSDWADLSLTLDVLGTYEILGHFNQLWTKATPITNQTISAVLSEERISQTAINNLLGSTDE